MSFSTRYVPAVLFTLFSLAVTVAAQSASTQTGKAPRGSISGRVTIKDKGAAGVVVSLHKSEMYNPAEQHARATTDHDGFYRLANVAAGSYEVAPSAPAFIPVDSQRAGRTVVVGEDENVEGINFALVRGGVIMGKVVDADGRPVILQQVDIFTADAFNRPPPQSQQQQAQQRAIFPLSNATTDDRGIYRMYGLRAGRYKVATGRSDETFAGGFSQQRSTYNQVFHPDVTDQARARIIEVTEGSEATNVDIALGAALRSFSVSGRIVDEKGLPVPNIPFALQRLALQRGEFINSPVTSDAHGDFYAEGLVPGKYQIYLFQELNKNDLRAEQATFEVIDQDVSNVVIKLSKGASLSGVVVIESDDKTVLQKLQQMRLMGYSTTPGTSSIGRTSWSMVSADGSFRLGGLPAGTINLQLSGTMGPFDLKGFAISRVERDGVAVQRGVEVKEGEQVGGIRVIVAHGNGSVRGVVKLENGPLPTGVQMYVRLTKPGENPGGIRPTQIDARGHFLMDGIPPGNYELVVHFFGTGAPQPPPPAAKREVSVQNGVVTDVIITIDLTTQPKP